MPTTSQLAWLAGLLEGEGCFQYYQKPNGGTPIIALNMTDRDVVERAATLLDGSDPKAREKFTKDGRPQRTMYSTRRCGVRAIGWMLTLYPFLGTRRRAKIREIVNLWRVVRLRRRPSLVRARRFCAHGHEFTAENTYFNQKYGFRACKICRRRVLRERNDRLKAARHARGLLDSKGRLRPALSLSLPSRDHLTPPR